MRILFATDGSESAETALDLLIDLPLRAHDHVTVLAVPVHSYVGIGLDGSGVFFAEVAEAEVVEARKTAERTLDRIHAKGVPSVSRVDDGPVPQTIIEVARAEHAGLIVLGSRGLGRVAGAILGSTARAVARHSPIPVLVAHERRSAPRRVLIAVDGSEDANAAIRTLAELPLVARTEITLMYVQPRREPRDLPNEALADELRAAMEREERRDGVDVISAAKELLPRGIVPRVEFQRGRTVEKILSEAAAQGTDLIVLGARGRTLRGDRFLQGSTADRILENAHCAVLVARAAHPSDAAKPGNGKMLARAG